MVVIYPIQHFFIQTILDSSFSDFRNKNCACEKHQHYELIFSKLHEHHVINYQDIDEITKSLCCIRDSRRKKEEC